jgi:hypothetical protein
MSDGILGGLSALGAAAAIYFACCLPLAVVELPDTLQPRVGKPTERVNPSAARIRVLPVG